MRGRRKIYGVYRNSFRSCPIIQVIMAPTAVPGRNGKYFQLCYMSVKSLLKNEHARALPHCRTRTRTPHTHTGTHAHAGTHVHTHLHLYSTLHTRAHRAHAHTFTRTHTSARAKKAVDRVCRPHVNVVNSGCQRREQLHRSRDVPTAKRTPCEAALLLRFYLA